MRKCALAANSLHARFLKVDTDTFFLSDLEIGVRHSIISRDVCENKRKAPTIFPIAESANNCCTKKNMEKSTRVA